VAFLNWQKRCFIHTHQTFLALAYLGLHRWQWHIAACQIFTLTKPTKIIIKFYLKLELIYLLTDVLAPNQKISTGIPNVPKFPPPPHDLIPSSFWPPDFLSSLK
jgi:hypothetical protein